MPTNYSSLSIARRPNPKTQTPSNSSKKAVTKVALRSRSSKTTVLAREANKSLTTKEAPPLKSSVGFVLMDSALNLIWSNFEATQILSYPDKLTNLRRQELHVTRRIRATLMNRPALGDSPFVTEFRSGRRRYFCRAFLVDSQTKDPAHPSIAVLLERGPSGLVSFSEVRQQFNLTQREREALEHLLQGLSSKEIANRMNISSNTVKAFLRLIMTKMGVASRAAVMRKIIMSQPR